LNYFMYLNHMNELIHYDEFLQELN
jgi:hypothetical protein